MAYNPKKPCKGRFNTCPNLVEMNQKYCPSCAPKEKERKRKETREYDKQRGNPQQRGYDARWNKVSALYRMHEPLCERCGMEAEEVHHIIPLKQGGAKYSFDNLMSVCRTCHNKIESRFK